MQHKTKNTTLPAGTLYQMEQYILIKLESGGAYNIATMENGHFAPVDIYAKLFVASPDLLKACEAALHGDKSLLAAAINKAKG